MDPSKQKGQYTTAEDVTCVLWSD